MAAAEQRSLKVGDTVDGFRLLQHLGAGGMGSVFRVQDAKGRDAALKVLHANDREDEEALLRFEREMDLLAEIRHPQIPRIFHRRGRSYAWRWYNQSPAVVLLGVGPWRYREILLALTTATGCSADRRGGSSDATSSSESVDSSTESGASGSGGGDTAGSDDGSSGSGTSGGTEDTGDGDGESTGTAGDGDGSSTSTGEEGGSTTGDGEVCSDPSSTPFDPTLVQPPSGCEPPEFVDKGHAPCQGLPEGCLVNTVCTDSTPILQPNGAPSGWELCAEGTVHRVSVEECVVQVPCAADGPTICNGYAGACPTASDVCFFSEPGCNPYRCSSQCATDADCDDGETCVCANVLLHAFSLGYLTPPVAASVCVPSKCEDDDSCGGGLCQLSHARHNAIWGTPGRLNLPPTSADHYRVTKAACSTPQDTCRSNADCSCGQCTFDSTENRFRCWNHATATLGAPYSGFYPYTYSCGRGRRADDPFGGAARSASIPSSDWLSLRSSSAHVSTPTTPGTFAAYEAAERWTRIAATEHASIASLAKFATEMMQLGAPAEIIDDILRAARDEVAHAQAAYAIASRLGEEPVGPGPLPSLAPPSSDIEDILIDLIEHACCEETLAALHLEASVPATSDPEIAAALRTMAQDELRHGELAWKALAWILRELDDDGSLLMVADAAFENAEATSQERVARFARKAPEHLHQELRAFGFSGPHLRARVLHEGWEEVIAPAWAQLRCTLMH